MGTTSLVIAIVSVIISMGTVIIAYLNRLDTHRPHINIYLMDERNELGQISKEYIYIVNNGIAPGKIINIKLIKNMDIIVRKREYEFVDFPDTSEEFLIKIMLH